MNGMNYRTAQSVIDVRSLEETFVAAINSLPSCSAHIQYDEHPRKHHTMHLTSQGYRNSNNYLKLHDIHYHFE